MSAFLYELFPGALGGCCVSQIAPLLPLCEFTSVFTSFMLLCGFVLLVVSVVFREEGLLHARVELAAF